MRTHHTLAEVAGRYKDRSLLPIARAFTAYIDEELNGDITEQVYSAAHYDPIILGLILGLNWPDCEEEVLAAIAADLAYDRMIISCSPKAETRVAKLTKGIDVSKLEIML